MSDKMPGEYRSNDMGCVAFLMLEGYASQRTEFEGSTCYWVFVATSSLHESVEAYRSDTAKVSPRAFNKMYAEVKRQFFDARN